jgi:hypothetical protein
MPVFCIVNASKTSPESYRYLTGKGYCLTLKWTPNQPSYRLTTEFLVGTGLKVEQAYA